MVWKDDTELILCMLNTQFDGVCRFEIVVVGVDIGQGPVCAYPS